MKEVDATFIKGDTVFDPDLSSKKRLFVAKADNIGLPLTRLKNEDKDWNDLIKKI